MTITGADVLEATRIDEAYELARTERPDAILLDLRLPDGDGLDLLRRIRRTASIARTPVLVITAGHDEANRAETVRAGADEYLAKPIEAEDLADRLQRLLDLDPTERRPRRREILRQLEVDHVIGDPDPPVDHTGGDLLGGEEVGKRRGLFHRRR